MRSPPSDYLKRRWARQQRLFEQFKPKESVMPENEFKDELETLMKKYGVATISYTIDDDGLHANLHNGGEWLLGWPSAEAGEPT